MNEGKAGLNNIDAQIREDLWTPEVMALAIAAKKESRETKGLSFNCFVLDRSSKNGDELTEFLAKLKNNISALPNNMRFQLAVRTDVHWTAFDVMVVDGKLKVFCMDAALDPRGGNALDEIKKVFPDSDRYLFVGGEVQITDVDSRQAYIQSDKTSCSRFTLDNIFHLSNMDTFGELAKKPHRNSYGDQCVTFASMTDNMANLFRNTQSWVILKNLPLGMQHQVINKKGETLISSAQAHSVDRAGKLINKSIDYKRERLAKTINEYVRATPENAINDILAKRQGFQFVKMEAGQFKILEQTSQQKHLPLPALKDVVGRAYIEQVNYLTSLGSAASGRLKKQVTALEKFNRQLSSVYTTQAALDLARIAVPYLDKNVSSVITRSLERMPGYDANDFQTSGYFTSFFKNVVGFVTSALGVDKIQAPMEKQKSSTTAVIMSKVITEKPHTHPASKERVEKSAPSTVESTKNIGYQDKKSQQAKQSDSGPDEVSSVRFRPGGR